MKYIKKFEKWEDHIWRDSENKLSPEGYKFQIGDHVKYKGYKWWKNNLEISEIYVICVVNKNINNPNNIFPYCIVPINAPNSDYEIWVSEEDLTLAPEHEINAIKYNL